MRNIAIIGAGIAGLAAARRLTAEGAQVTLFEKSRGVGGRVATRRVEGCILDHGAQILKPDGFTLGDVMQNELPTRDLVRVTMPVRPYASDNSILPPDPARAAERQFTYRNGLTTLPKLLFRALPSQKATIRYETRISALEQEGSTIVLRDESGSEAGRADQVILTAPAPQAADLLSASRLNEGTREAQIAALRSVVYNPCLTVLLGYKAPAPPPPAYALLSEDRNRPLLWLAFEAVKCPERAPNGEALLIAQLGPEISRGLYDSPDAEIYQRTLTELHGLFGDSYENPLWWQVKRWRYSQPRGMVSFAEANPETSAVVVCGDSLRPDNGRVHQAYESGIEAAEHILNIF